MEQDYIPDLSRLKTVLDFLSTSMNLGICFIDTDLKNILYKSDRKNICTDIKSSSDIKNIFCIDLIKNLSDNEYPEFLTCSKNLTIVHFAVKNNNLLLGWIIMGPVILKDIENPQLNKIPEIPGIPDIPVLDSDTLESKIIRIKPMMQLIIDLFYEKYLLNKEKNLIKYNLEKQKLTERELKQTNSELETIFTNSQVGIMYLKGGRYFLKGNKRLADILGWDNPDEMTGINMRKLHISDETFTYFGEKYFNNLAHGERIHIDYQLAKKDGTPVWCILSGKAIDRNNPADLNKGVIWIIDDISDRKEAEKKLKKLAVTDFLTSLKNRAGFHRELEKEIHRSGRQHKALSLMLIDLDYFKNINDTYGHDAGDAVLVHFSNLLESTFRDIDISGRVGGEEFAVIMPDTTLESGRKAAVRLKRKLEKENAYYRNIKIPYTVSIGISEYSDESLDDFYCITDKKLYRAKTSGRNCICTELQD